MVTRTERDLIGTGGAWGSMACDQIIPEDISFLIVCDKGSRDSALKSTLVNTLILAGATGFMVVLNILL